MKALLASTGKPRGLPLPCLLCLTALSCKPDYGVTVQKKILRTEALVDADMVAVGDRQTVTIQLRSEGAAPVTVFDIAIESEDQQEAFVLLPWADDDDTLQIPGGNESNPGIETIQVSFRPTSDGPFHATMTIESDDTESLERTEDGRAIWMMALRGIARYPCGFLGRSFLDYGSSAAGGAFYKFVDIHNCGQVLLTIAGFNWDNSNFYVSTPDPVYIVPNATEYIEIGFTPADTSPTSTILSYVTNDPFFTETTQLMGNDCKNSTDESWDWDGDGWFSCGGDCDDLNAAVNPSALEIENKLDDDCDELVDETDDDPSSDDDSDGYSEDQGDCDDSDPDIHPGIQDQPDQVDNDCNGIVDDGTDWFDDDADGYSEREGDCDDSDPEINPNSQELVDGLDNDCDGLLDEGGPDFDDDGDGYADNQGDCNDADPWVYSGAIEDCDDIDNNCDGQIDEGDACAYLVEQGAGSDTGSGTTPSTCSIGAAKATPALPAWLVLMTSLLRRRRAI